MAVNRYRARRSQKGILKLTANGHYDFKSKRLKYVGSARGLQDAANAEFVIKTVESYLSKLTNDLAQQKRELNSALEELSAKINITISKKQIEMESIVDDSLNELEIKTVKFVKNEDEKIKRYVNDSVAKAVQQISEVGSTVRWMQNELYSLHENKTQSALEGLNKRVDVISRTLEQSIVRNE